MFFAHIFITINRKTRNLYVSATPDNAVPTGLRTTLSTFFKRLFGLVLFQNVGASNFQTIEELLLW